MKIYIIIALPHGVHTRCRHGGDDTTTTNTPGRRRRRRMRRRTPRGGDFYVRVRRVRARSFLRLARAQILQRENESIVGENASVSLVDVERVHPDLGPAGRGILAEQNERRRGRRERTNDGRDVGIDVLVDVFSHLGDFTVAPDLRGQVLDNNFSVMSRIFTWAVVEYISVSPSTSIFNRSVLLCRPCLRRGVLTTFLFILTASRAAATLRSRRGVPPR